MVDVSASILNLDFRNLEKAIKRIETAGIDSLHMDIMDGNFVPNISFGPSLVETVSEITDLPIHTHLMILNPEKYVSRFFDAGSTTVTFHLETINQNNKDLLLLDNIGISFNPNIDVNETLPYVEKASRVLVMSVMAGFGGQDFIESCLKSIEVLANKKEELGYGYIVSVDGGINYENACKCVSAGADELAVGTYITRSPDPAENIRKLKGISCKER